MARKNYTAGREHAQMLLNALLMLVEELAESTDCAGLEKMAKANWQADTELWVTQTTLKGLAELTERYGHSLDTEQIRNAMACLFALKILEDKREQISRKTKTNSDVWRFALKLPSIDKEENLKWLFEPEAEWDKRRQSQKSKPGQVQKPTAPKSQGIDWSKICRTMLKKQKRLTTNELLSADEDMKFELDDIHVPLALVQRTKPDKRSGDVSPEEGSRLLQPTYEEKQRFRHEEFLAQVLQEGKGQSKGRRIAVIGEPGAGKTTLLQSIAFWLFEDKNKNLGLPIWISLADLQGKTLEEYLLQRWLKNALEVVCVTPEQENALVELFKKERVWLFLDGVDEIAGDSVGVGANGRSPLQAISSQLEGWVAKARVVLSCRLNVWEANINALGDDFEKYRLLDFDYPLEVKKFICRWFRKTDADKGERLWAELDKSERQRIQDLVKNPLRLALLCSTWQSSDKGLPSTKAGLYQQFLTEFYKWKENRFPTTEDQQEELNAALGRLAKRAIDQEASRFRLRHQLLREELGDPKQQGSLFWLALQLGWLNKVGLAAESETQEKVYAFYHPTFQEYFAALAIAHWQDFMEHNPKQGIDRIFKPQWKEVILLWLGRPQGEVAKNQKEEFIKALVEFEDGCGGFYRFRAYFLAASGIAEFMDCSSSRADEIMAQIVKWGFGEFNDKKKKWVKFIDPIQEEARVALLETERTKAITALVELISGFKNEYTCSRAAESLGKIGSGNPTAITALVELISKCKNKYNQNRVAQSLRNIDSINLTALDTLEELSNDYQDVLEELINKFQNEDIRWKEDNLKVIGSDNHATIADLVELINNSEDKNTLWQAADKLGKIGLGNPTAITALVKLINNYKDEIILWSAIGSLGKIGLGNHTAIAALVKLISNSQDENTCKVAVNSLGKIGLGNDAAIAALITLIANSQEQETRRLAAYNLREVWLEGQMGGVVTKLRGCVSDKTYKNDFRRYRDCYSVLWQCAKKMTYSAFHEAWHQQEGVGKTTTLDRQTLKNNQ